jgi:hypothetical protein
VAGWLPSTNDRRRRVLTAWLTLLPLACGSRSSGPPDAAPAVDAPSAPEAGRGDASAREARPDLAADGEDLLGVEVVRVAGGQVGFAQVGDDERHVVHGSRSPLGDGPPPGVACAPTTLRVSALEGGAARTTAVGPPANFFEVRLSGDSRHYAFATDPTPTCPGLNALYVGSTEGGEPRVIEQAPVINLLLAWGGSLSWERGLDRSTNSGAIVRFEGGGGVPLWTAYGPRVTIKPDPTGRVVHLVTRSPAGSVARSELLVLGAPERRIEVPFPEVDWAPDGTRFLARTMGPPSYGPLHFFSPEGADLGPPLPDADSRLVRFLPDGRALLGRVRVSEADPTEYVVVSEGRPSVHLALPTVPAAEPTGPLELGEGSGGRYLQELRGRSVLIADLTRDGAFVPFSYPGRLVRLVFAPGQALFAAQANGATLDQPDQLWVGRPSDGHLGRVPVDVGQLVGYEGGGASPKLAVVVDVDRTTQRGRLLLLSTDGQGPAVTVAEQVSVEIQSLGGGRPGPQWTGTPPFWIGHFLLYARRPPGLTYGPFELWAARADGPQVLVATEVDTVYLSEHGPRQRLFFGRLSRGADGLWAASFPEP